MVAVWNSKQGGVKTYEKDGELYYDYVSEGEQGYAITVNVNNEKELSRTQILEYTQELRMWGKGSDYKEQHFMKYHFVLPKELTIIILMKQRRVLHIHCRMQQGEWFY